MRRQKGGRRLVGRRGLPLGRLRGHQLQPAAEDRLAEAVAPLLAVERGHHPLQDGHLRTGRQFFHQVLTHLQGPRIIVGPHERDFQLELVQYLRVEPVVDVHNLDALGDRALQRGGQGLRVGRRDDDRIHPLRHHFRHQGRLTRDITLIRDAVDDQLIFVGVGRLVLFGPLGHRAEKLVGQRFHHQRDPRLGRFVPLGHGARLAAAPRQPRYPRSTRKGGQRPHGFPACCLSHKCLP